MAIPSRVLAPLVLVLLVAVAAFLALRRNFGAEARPAPPRPLPRTVLIALVIAFYDGFFGPGTGTFLIMAFVLWLGDRMAAASANAKVVNFASNLAALALFALSGRVLWAVALPMAASQALGATLGARLVRRGGDRFVRVVVLAVVAALALKIAWDLHG
jgi:hypothetical protein